MTATDDPFKEPFGSLFGPAMTVASLKDDGIYDYGGSAQALENFSMHPGTHVLHYASACFEGLKAHRQGNGSLAIFRLDDHVQRMLQSIAKLRMAVPDGSMLRAMMIDAVEANASSTPDPPGSLYIRPTLIGTMLNIGAAASPSTEGLLYVICSPVGDYFAGGVRPLTVCVETTTPRTTPQFGMVKSGANYVMALGPTLDAKAAFGADQVLFGAGDDVTETGASNFFLTDSERLVTRQLDGSFLHGVTRDSIIKLAADLGYAVEERAISVNELVGWAERGGEVFLSGTAAVVAPVGTLIVEGGPVVVGDGEPGRNTLKLRNALTAIQLGDAPDPHSWRMPVEG